jgi:hypothetical protein
LISYLWHAHSQDRNSNAGSQKHSGALPFTCSAAATVPALHTFFIIPKTRWMR